ncbi:MAG: dihydrodipicolinate synthase family protein [Burkholderiaceae bacterium]
MNANKLTGVVPAIPTPVTTDREPDVGRLLAFAERLFADGVHGLNVTGTTGEATSMSLEQRKKVIAGVAASKLPKDRVMVGTGAAAVADAVALTRCVEDAGLAGALVLPPFYFKDPSVSGLLRYFDAIMQATSKSGLDIYLYNFPALSGIPYSKELVAALTTEFGTRIAGLKDSSGDMAYATEIAQSFPKMNVFPSNEAAIPQCRDKLFAGCISATANLSAKLCATAFDNADDSALETAKAIRAKIAEGPLVPRIKAVLADQLSDPAWANVLPPYASLSPGEQQELNQSVKAISG